ncbi:MAG: hypothetical protein ABI405_07150 [Parafilimonas sp.]
MMNYLKTYVPRALIAAGIYCITVIIFLSKGTYESIWILYCGNALYLISMAIIIYITYSAQKFETSPLTSTISGHILSVTGAAITVIVSVILYLLFYLGIGGLRGETLQDAPAGLAAGATHGILFVLIMNAVFGNTIAGFFAALFTSFDATKNHAH